MKILLIGEDTRIADFQAGLDLSKHETDISDGAGDEDFKDYDLIFDLNLDDQPENLKNYAHLKRKPIFGSSVKLSCAEMQAIADVDLRCSLIGINALPTFLSLEKWEIALHNQRDRGLVKAKLEELGKEYFTVKDRVGMVAPRVIFMIINEACYTLQEGTASIEDINLAMKLGTNYPLGPFEWADKIGVHEVFETLASLYEDTRDERYKICPLLKTMYLKGESFAN